MEVASKFTKFIILHISKAKFCLWPDQAESNEEPVSVISIRSFCPTGWTVWAMQLKASLRTIRFLTNCGKNASIQGWILMWKGGSLVSGHKWLATTFYLGWHSVKGSWKYLIILARLCKHSPCLLEDLVFLLIWPVQYWSIWEMVRHSRCAFQAGIEEIRLPYTTFSQRLSAGQRVLLWYLRQVPPAECSFSVLRRLKSHLHRESNKAALWGTTCMIMLELKLAGSRQEGEQTFHWGRDKQ